MKGFSADDALQAFLDGDLLPEVEQAALHAIADDAEARSLLRFEQKLQQFFGPPSTPSVAADFTDRVMINIDLPKPTPQKMIWWQVLWQWLIGPRALPLRPVYVVMGLVLVGLVGLGIYQTTPLEQTVQLEPDAESVLIRFMYVHEDAATVAVAGDFSNWEPIPLTWQHVNGQSVWTAEVVVPRQSHRYMFVLDDSKWVTDPLALVHEDDGFGRKNAVLTFL